MKNMLVAKLLTQHISQLLSPTIRITSPLALTCVSAGGGVQVNVDVNGTGTMHAYCAHPSDPNQMSIVTLNEINNGEAPVFEDGNIVDLHAPALPNTCENHPMDGFRILRVWLNNEGTWLHDTLPFYAYEQT